MMTTKPLAMTRTIRSMLREVGWIDYDDNGKIIVTKTTTTILAVAMK